MRKWGQTPPFTAGWYKERLSEEAEEEVLCQSAETLPRTTAPAVEQPGTSDGFLCNTFVLFLLSLWRQRRDPESHSLLVVKTVFRTTAWTRVLELYIHFQVSTVASSSSGKHLWFGIFSLHVQVKIDWFWPSLGLRDTTAICHNVFEHIIVTH